MIKTNRNIYKLYIVTDSAWLNGKKLSDAVCEAILGGATIVQYREKNLSGAEYEKQAYEVMDVCRKHGVPFVINDNVEFAKKCNADGVHLGQSDMDPLEARKILGNDKIIGVSARTVEQALLAQEKGADYLGSGAVFGTGTKNDAKKLSIHTLKEICTAVDIPVVAIGGINDDNITELSGSGICGTAIVSAVFAKKNIREAAFNLKEKIEGLLSAADRGHHSLSQ